MFVEPGLLDANVLTYAINADAPQHAAARALVEAGSDPSTTLYVTLQVLCEFYGENGESGFRLQVIAVGMSNVMEAESLWCC